MTGVERMAEPMFTDQIVLPVSSLYAVNHPPSVPAYTTVWPRAWL